MGYTIFRNTNPNTTFNFDHQKLKQSKNYQSNVSILRYLHVFQMLKTVAQSIASTSSSQRETCVRASRVFKFNTLRKWLLIAFCLENPLLQITILDGMSIYFGQSCISLGQFVCHSKLLPHMRQASNIFLFSHSCRSIFVNSRSSPSHMLFSSSVYWNFNNIILSHNSVFVV